MKKYSPAIEYDIVTHNRFLKRFLDMMFDKYGISDYAISTKISEIASSIEIYPSNYNSIEKQPSMNKLDSIDELVLYQYHRLEHEIRNNPFFEPESLKYPKNRRDRNTDSIFKNLRDGFSYLYLVKEEKPVKSFKIFLGFLAEGVNGLCISKMNPELLYSSYGLNSKNIIWLCNTDGENNINPKDLSSLVNRINDFIIKNGNSVILLEGLEYLISHNGLKKVLNILNSLNKQINKDSMFILPIHPEALEKADLDQLEKSILQQY